MAHTDTQNRAIKEIIAYFWLATLGSALCLTLMLFLWFAWPNEPVIFLGHITEFQANKLSYHAPPSAPAVYVTNLEGQLLAWDARPALPQQGCQLAWVSITNRFEDPCTGAKWCLDGRIADTRFTQARSLDRYELDITPKGEVWLYPARKIKGSPLPEGTYETSFTQFPPEEIYNCQHLIPLR